jgi:hypothetical protein
MELSESQKQALATLAGAVNLKPEEIKALIPTLVDVANADKASKILKDQEVDVVVSSISRTGAELSATGFSGGSTGVELSLNGETTGFTVADVSLGGFAVDIFLGKTEVTKGHFHGGGFYLGS